VDSEGEDRVGQALCRLPARMGGLGVYSHRDCAPHASASANDTADVLVDAIFDLESGDEEAPKSQKERCSAMWDEQASGSLHLPTIPTQRPHHAAPTLQVAWRLICWST